MKISLLATLVNSWISAQAAYIGNSYFQTVKSENEASTSNQLASSFRRFDNNLGYVHFIPAILPEKNGILSPITSTITIGAAPTGSVPVSRQFRFEHHLHIPEDGIPSNPSFVVLKASYKADTSENKGNIPAQAIASQQQFKLPSIVDSTKTTLKNYESFMKDVEEGKSPLLPLYFGSDTHPTYIPQCGSEGISQAKIMGLISKNFELLSNHPSLAYPKHAPNSDDHKHQLASQQPQTQCLLNQPKVMREQIGAGSVTTGTLQPLSASIPGAKPFVEKSLNSNQSQHQFSFVQSGATNSQDQLDGPFWERIFNWNIPSKIESISSDTGRFSEYSGRRVFSVLSLDMRGINNEKAKAACRTNPPAPSTNSMPIPNQPQLQIHHNVNPMPPPFIYPVSRTKILPDFQNCKKHLHSDYEGDFLKRIDVPLLKSPSGCNFRPSRSQSKIFKFQLKTRQGWRHGHSQKAETQLKKAEKHLHQAEQQILKCRAHCYSESSVQKQSVAAQHYAHLNSQIESRKVDLNLSPQVPKASQRIWPIQRNFVNLQHRNRYFRHQMPERQQPLNGTVLTSASNPSIQVQAAIISKECAVQPGKRRVSRSKYEEDLNALVGVNENIGQYAPLNDKGEYINRAHDYDHSEGNINNFLFTPM